MHATLASNPGETYASKRRSQIPQEPAIHPRDANIHLLRDAVAAF
jgi:hypothetical protein